MQWIEGGGDKNSIQSVHYGATLKCSLLAGLFFRRWFWSPAVCSLPLHCLRAMPSRTALSVAGWVGPVPSTRRLQPRRLPGISPIGVGIIIGMDSGRGSALGAGSPDTLDLNAPTDLAYGHVINLTI